MGGPPERLEKRRVAQYRLEIQAIKRGEGRSAVAAAAYRSATRLRDARLEMVFDYAARGGVVVAGIMAPDETPGWLLEREGLWNAAEAADRRADSRTAREVLLSLPHELSDHQRHELLRDFLGEALVAKGMIADYAIHRPDAHGDPRNHHAHVMVTTREVSAEGFGLKGRAWDNPEAVRELRALWAQIQNRHLREVLGPDAPQVSHLSLRTQGEGREPTVHLGPAASAMERRGEVSDRGETNRKIAERNAERLRRPQEIAALEDQMAVRQEANAYPIGLVIDEFQSIHQSMVAERAAWSRQLGAIAVPEPPRGRDVAREVLGETLGLRKAAQARLLRSQTRIEASRRKRQSLARWISQPGRMVWAAHAELNRLARDRQALAAADAAWRVRRDWLASGPGKAYVAARLNPAQQAKDGAERERRTLERKIKRADRRIEQVARTRTKLLVARELGQEVMAAPSQMRLGVGQAVREVDRRVVAALQAHGPSAQQAALDKVLRALRSGPSPDR